MRRVIVGVARDLVLSLERGRDRSVVRTFAYMIPVALVVLIGHRSLYSGTAPPTGTAHPEQSINVALNAQYCGKPSGWSQRYSVQSFLTTRLDLMSKPFRNVIAAMTVGSVEDYCRTVNELVVVSENSLMWLARFALWRDPQLTPDRLGQFLGACRVFMLLVFGFALLRTGASVLFTMSAVVIGAEVLRSLGVRDSIYPFAMALPLLHAGVYGIAMSSRPVSRMTSGGVWLWVFALGMGILTAFSASMRTIQLFTGVGMFGVFLFVLFVRRDRPQRAAVLAKTFGGAVAAFAIGYSAYVAVFVAPLRNPDPTVSNYVYHTFAHEIVLGLAVPENDLSRREGVQWNDMVGFAMAKRAMPEVTYLGPLYETALLRYYRGLWAKDPAGMLRVYLAKLRSDGDEVFLSAAGIATQYFVPPIIGESLHKVTNGFVLVLLGLCVCGAALVRHIGGGGNRLLIVSLVSLAALASLAEGFLTYSIFVGIYYSILLYFVFLASLLLIQAGLDSVARLLPASFRNPA